jgi:hypothetical protein
VFILTGCVVAPAPEPTPTAAPPYRITPDENPFEPQIGDVGRQIATVTITSVSLSELYDYSPPRSMISLVGYMPSVCNELRVDIGAPDENFNVFVEVYSLIDPTVQCDNVFQQFETSILREISSLIKFLEFFGHGLHGFHRFSRKNLLRICSCPCNPSNPCT